MPAQEKSKFNPGNTLNSDEAGVNYFRGSKVGSAKGYIGVAGHVLAVPHAKRSKSAVVSTRFDSQAEYQHKFREQPYCYASMDSKPLCPYDPLSYRSRLAVEDAPVPYKNASIVNFHDGIHTCHKKRFVTTHQTHFTGEPCDPRSNQGVKSEATKFRRSQQAK
eukprot:gnl/MRDRNA2_/MRDRNA2_58807_c0_seq1.p1 gnl/MRDRNA2_/MRDRNA2_58807_c0~~gnl/MRDRNA2_/MRDRNA2_58807_c0_seq1.p1  ORF type:complete len:163 (-),score=30.64 gnl/MRDRNA2_/MRDRNA2_58807_c0_seq1:45-533(-)